MSSATVASIVAERRKALAALRDAENAMHITEANAADAVKAAETAVQQATEKQRVALAEFRRWNSALTAVAPDHEDL